MCINCFEEEPVKGRYTQCALQKGDVWQTVFIPSKFAKLGETIKLKNGEVWEDGWKVRATYKTIDQGTAQMNYDNQKRFEKVLNEPPAKRRRG